MILTTIAFCVFVLIVDALCAMIKTDDDFEYDPSGSSWQVIEKKS